MALGILEPKVEHVPGTVFVYETEQRHAELLGSARHLKKDKTGRIILVPQPSDDPNDPLVCSFHAPQDAMVLTLMAELASLAARCHSRNPVLRILSGNHGVSSPRSRLGHPWDSFQANIPRCGAAHGLPPLRRMRSWMVVCRVGKSMGQEASIPLRSTAHDCKLGLGWF